MVLINFFEDLFTFIKFKKIEKNFKFIFFNENEYTFSYIKDYILSKKNISNVVVLSIEKVHLQGCNVIRLKTNFFLKLFFLTLNIRYVYSTTTNLNNSIFLRSKVSNNRYIYLQHSPVSLSMIYDEKAFVFFDAIQVINKSQYNDVRDINKLFKKKIKPFKSKYRFISKKLNELNKQSIDVLIAPTWHTDFYKLNIHEKLFEIFKKENISFEFRPHPMSIKKKEFRINNNIKINTEKFIDFGKFKFLISDWSGIFIEFAIINKSRPILINTSKKILNKNYLSFSNLPIELVSRKTIATEFETDKIDDIANYILNQSDDEYKNIIKYFYENNFF